jgi:hypothetical protein
MCNFIVVVDIDFCVVGKGKLLRSAFHLKRLRAWHDDTHYNVNHYDDDNNRYRR